MTVDAPRRSSRRISSTPKKSRYFEESEVDEDDLTPMKRGRPSKKQKTSEVDTQSTPKKRGRPSKDKPLLKEETSEDEQYKEDEGEEEEEGNDDDDSEEYNNDSAQDEKGVEEEEEEDDDDEDAPPRVKIIPLEKMRDTGGVEYEDSKIHKNTLLFLKDLKANNRRPWLKSHDGEYRRALKDWNSFIERATETLIDADDTIPELPLKDVVFRIHRDIRFSKDPTPYKPHFSAAWSRTGRKGPYACYYIQCDPGSSFVGGGVWCPEKEQLRKVRESIDERPNRWRRVLNEPEFKAMFLPSVKARAGPEAALKAFAEKNKHNALKTKPMGYGADHRDIGLLKLRSFTVNKKIDEKILCGDDAQERFAEIMRPMVGFITFLNNIVMPDPNLDDEDTEGEDESEEDEDEDEDEDEEGNEEENEDV